jgi:hypothetical protein
LKGYVASNHRRRSTNGGLRDVTGEAAAAGGSRQWCHSRSSLKDRGTMLHRPIYLKCSFALQDEVEVGNSPVKTSGPGEAAKVACDGVAIALTFGNGARWLRWMADVKEEQTGVIVTSLILMLGRQSSGHVVAVQRR